MSSRIETILLLVQAIKVRELAAMAEISSRRSDFVEKVKAERQKKVGVGFKSDTQDAVEYRMRAENYVRLLNHNIAGLNVELANVSAELETQKSKTARAVGKVDAVQKITRNALYKSAIEE